MSSSPSDVFMNGGQVNNNGSVGSGGTSSRGTSRQRALQKGSRQASEDSVPTRLTRRPLHPAEKKAQQLKLPGDHHDNHSPIHAMHALRRLSRADFSSIRRAGLLQDI